MELWQDAVKIAADIYRFSEVGKLKNDWGMKDQLRRAASSISNNIAEGFEYNNNPDFIRFLRYAKGSAGEVRNQLYILKEAGFIESKEYQEFHTRLISLSKQIAGFKKYLTEYQKK
ncbi:MAG: four helix bundle protein [Cytophagales bacterium]|nr:four helix bundle protein [Cytophagales bacterium]